VEKLGAEVTCDGWGLEVGVSVEFALNDDGMMKLLLFVGVPVGG